MLLLVKIIVVELGVHFHSLGTRVSSNILMTLNVGMSLELFKAVLGHDGFQKGGCVGSLVETDLVLECYGLRARVRIAIQA